MKTIIITFCILLFLDAVNLFHIVVYDDTLFIRIGDIGTLDLLYSLGGYKETNVVFSVYSFY